MTGSSPRSSCVGWLYTNNPFYAISAALMLFAVRAGYGKLEIGLINCWVMLGVLAGYTLLLAVVGVLIVRLGKVWEDARSILLLLLLLFLAVSISADDLFVKMTSPQDGAVLLMLGFVFSVAVTIGVLRGAQIRLSGLFFIPYLLFLALFFVTPWWCSPELHPRPTRDLNWLVFLFPQAAAVVGLTLLPAARRGANAAADNGTPWPWPWFPWTAFGVIGVAVAIRSFALAMTFGQTGDIWHDIKSRSGIVFDTIWGPYFLVPFAAVVLLLVMESHLASGSTKRAANVLLMTPLLLLMSLPWSSGPAFQAFLGKVTLTVGSPIWLTILLLAAFFLWALMRRVTGAEIGFIAMTLLLSVVQANTIDRATLSTPQSGPLLVAGGIILILAIKHWSSFGCFAAAVVLTIGLWLMLTELTMVRFRFVSCYHLMLASCVAIGLTYRDSFARALQAVGAIGLPLTSLIVLVSRSAEVVPIGWRLLYVVCLAAICLVCAKMFRNRWYLYASTGTTAIFGYGLMMFGFRSAASVIGRAAMTAFSWSAATFLIALLISAHKANWLPRRLLPDWNGSPNPELASSSEGLDSLSMLSDKIWLDDNHSDSRHGDL